VAEPFHAQHAGLCTIRRDGSVLRLIGDIEQANWRNIADRIAAEIHSGATRLDLTQVRFFGAAGVRALMKGCEARPGGVALQLSCAPVVFRALQICGLLTMSGLVFETQANEQAPPEVGR
jgi:anti-anti-sigma factor